MSGQITILLSGRSYVKLSASPIGLIPLEFVVWMRHLASRTLAGSIDRCSRDIVKKSDNYALSLKSFSCCPSSVPARFELWRHPSDISQALKTPSFLFPTHSISGLSQNDFIMAVKISNLITMPKII